MNDIVDPLAEETIAHVFVLRERLLGASHLADIYAHESLLVRSTSGKHRIYERWSDGCSVTNVPGPASGENVQIRFTRLGNRTESYKAKSRDFDKQIHGQKVEKTVTFGDLNNFTANNKDFNENYRPLSNNCQDYQEKVRLVLLGLPVNRSLRTAFTKNITKLLDLAATRGHASVRPSKNAPTARGSLTQTSDSDGSHNIDLDSSALPSALPSSNSVANHERASATSLGHQATGSDCMNDGAVPHLSAESLPFSSFNTSYSSSSFAEAQAESNAKAESEFRKRAHQFQTHAPGILGATENVVNCFRQGEYFAGVWNTGALAWSCGVLYSTGGMMSIIVEAPPNLDASPRVRLAFAWGLLSIG